MVRCLSLSLCVLIAALLALGAAGLVASPPAQAAPDEPTLTLVELQALLDAAPTGKLPGYFKTVVSGATIEMIPMNVLSVVPNAGYDGITLIMFEATGPIIDGAGGIVAGMSGSPLYVNDGGGDKLIGALSYGDIFTLGGLGLATPIEYMSAIENDYLGEQHTVTLAEPVTTSYAGIVDRVVLAPSATAAKRVKPALHKSVMAPMSFVQVGGLRPGTRLYDQFVKRTNAVGLEVFRGADAGAAGWDPGFETPLVAGAAVAEMLCRGDLWDAGIGTVTYAHDDTVLAFGHPMLWEGREIATDLANAYVHGIWPSSYWPYKLASPGKVRGTFLQDRRAGIAGKIGLLPVEVPITTAVELVPEGRSATSASYVPQWVADNPDYSFLDAYPVAIGIWKVTDAGYFPGSISFTATIVVSDGAQTYTIARQNLWDDEWGVDFDPVMELDTIIYMLTANPDGVAPASIKSVDFQAQITRQRRSATLLDVAVPGGLKRGDNTVVLTFRPYGSLEPQTVETTLTIPPGWPTKGRLAVDTWGYGDYMWDYMWGSEEFEEEDGGSGGEPATVADIVATINAWPHNSDVTLTFTPDWDGSPPLPMEGGSEPGAPGSDEGEVRVTESTDWATFGYAYKRTARMSFKASRDTVAYKGRVLLHGWIDGVSEETPVKIYARPAGADSRTLLATVMATADESGEVARFELPVRNLTKTTRFTAVWDGNEDFLGRTIGRSVAVRARVTLRQAAQPNGRVRLVADLLPKGIGGLVEFQLRAGGRWVHLATTGITSAGWAAMTWTPPAGASVVRAHYQGSKSNAAAYSNRVTVRR